MIVSVTGVNRGQSATTTAALSIGLCTALHYKLRVLIISVQSKNDLMHYVTTKRMIEDGLNERGSEDLLRLSKNGLLHPQSIRHHTTPILKHSLLDVLPNFDIDIEDASSMTHFLSLLEMAKTSYDCIILDTDIAHAQAISSDAVVLTVNQNRQTIHSVKEALAMWPENLPTYVCAGRYDPSLKMNEKQIKHMLGVSDLMTIHYNPRLVDVFNIGNTLEYFGRYFYNEKLDQKNPYIKSVLKSTGLLLASLSLAK